MAKERRQSIPMRHKAFVQQKTRNILNKTFVSFEEESTGVAVFFFLCECIVALSLRCAVLEALSRHRSSSDTWKSDMFKPVSIDR